MVGVRGSRRCAGWTRSRIARAVAHRSPVNRVQPEGILTIPSCQDGKPLVSESRSQSAAIYARISADVEGTGLGVARQLEDCRKLAADRGWPVGDEYVDNDVSAFSGKPRREYARMLTDLKSGARDAVIVYNLDRLHRRPVELEEFVALCESVGVRDVATVTADIDLGNDDGLFMARIFAAFAAKESGRKSARIRRKMLQNAEQGLPHGSVRPFGYEPDKITVRSDEAAVVREMVDRYLAGAVDSVADDVAQRVRRRAGGIQVVADLGGAPNHVLGPHRRAARASRPGDWCGGVAGDHQHRRSGIRCWPAWLPARSSRPAHRAPTCCRGCCAAGGAATGCIPKPAMSIPRIGCAGMCV